MHQRRHAPLQSVVGVLVAVVVALASGCGQDAGGDKTRSEQATAASTSRPDAHSTSGLGSDTYGEPFAYGDDSALDALWDACEGGDTGACSDLFFESPIDSDYETFGATCGLTADWGTCASMPEGGPAPTNNGGNGDSNSGGDGDSNSGGDGDLNSGGNSNWWASAEEVCTSVYLTRGASEWSLSHDYHDDMMMYYMWLADLLAREADALVGIGGAPAEGDAMIQELSYLSDLYREEAGIESEHYIINQRQNEIDAETPVVSASIKSRAQAGGAPTCGELTSGTSG